MKNGKFFILIFQLVVWLGCYGCAGKKIGEFQQAAENNLHTCDVKFSQKKYREAATCGEELLKRIDKTDLLSRNASFARTVGAGLSEGDGDAWLMASLLLFPPGWFVLAGEVTDSAVDLFEKDGASNELIVNENFGKIDAVLNKSQQIKLYRILGEAKYHQGEFHEAARYLEKSIHLENQFRVTLQSEKMRQKYSHNATSDLDTLISSLYKSNKFDLLTQYIDYSKAKTSSERLLSGRVRKYHRKTVNSSQIAQLQIEHIRTMPVIESKDINRYKRSLRGIKVASVENITENTLLKNISVFPVEFSKFTSIPDDVACLSYYITDGNVFSVLVLNGKVVSHDMRDISRDELESIIVKYSKAAAENDADSFHQYSQLLYEMLLARHVAILDKRGVKTLIISPHRILHKLSFNGLSDGCDYLMNKYSVSCIYSFNLFHIIANNKKEWDAETHDLAVFADPINNNKVASRLPGARQEAYVIKGRAKNGAVDIYFEKNATETRVLEELTEAGIAHFATHSVFNPENADSSFIYLANDKSSDGFLFAHELLSVKRRNPLELVVLSSCESGVTKLTPGDDHAGLTRSFFMIGANRIISTFWPIQDNSTVPFMDAFYSGLFQENARPGEAFRNAALKVEKRNQKDLNWVAFKYEGLPW